MKRLIASAIAVVALSSLAYTEPPKRPGPYLELISLECFKTSSPRDSEPVVLHIIAGDEKSGDAFKVGTMEPFMNGKKAFALPKSARRSLHKLKAGDVRIQLWHDYGMFGIAPNRKLGGTTVDDFKPGGWKVTMKREGAHYVLHYRIVE